MAEISIKEAENYIKNGGETAWWLIAPSDIKEGRVSPNPCPPDGYTLYDPDPSWKGQKYWYIKKI